MNGSSPESERFRRFPLTWAILGAVFTRIPLFSLAKTLADRKFAAVLQLTAGEISKPKKATSSDESADVEMTDAPAVDNQTGSRKRKRSRTSAFDLDSLKALQACLQSAEALFGALSVLLSRLDSDDTERKTSERIGAEHIRSLFCSTASESAERLAPLLALCELAIDGQEGELENQEFWIDTVTSIWNLHLQGPEDASQFATHLSRTGCLIAGKLADIPHAHHVAIPTAVREAWLRDIRRLLTSNVILPARNAFINESGQQVLDIVIAMSERDIAIASPILWDLTLKAPRAIGETGQKQEAEKWVHHVFDLLDEPLRARPRDSSTEAVSLMLDMAIQRGVSPSLDSLRKACRYYAILEKSTVWSVVSRITECDADTFLVGQGASSLAETVFARAGEVDSGDASTYESVLQSMIFLVKGSAKSRDLAALFRQWFESLRATIAGSISGASGKAVWFDQRLGQTVADLIQSSMTTRQLLALIDWLKSHDSQDAAQNIAQIIILDAISGGISQEEYVDALQTAVFDYVFALDLPSHSPAAVSRARWNIATQVLRWSTVEQSGRIWGQIKSELGEVLLRTETPADSVFLGALRCCFAAWLSQHPDGPFESDSREIAGKAFERWVAEVGSDMSAMRNVLVNLDVSQIPRDATSPTSGVVHDLTRFTSYVLNAPCVTRTSLTLWQVARAEVLGESWYGTSFAAEHHERTRERGSGRPNSPAGFYWDCERRKQCQH